MNLVPLYDPSPTGNNDLGITGQAMAGVIDANLGSDADNLNNPSSGVSICFASGTTNQSGLITIGGNGRQLSVKLSIMGDSTCS